MRIEIERKSSAVEATVNEAWEPQTYDAAVRLPAFQNSKFIEEILDKISLDEEARFSGFEVVHMLFDAYRRGEEDGRLQILAMNGDATFSIPEIGATNV